MQIVLTPKTLGKGQYGQVHLAYQKGDPSKVFAVKVIDRKRIRGQKPHDLLVNEIEIMTEIKDKNVVGLVTATKTMSNYYLVMEFCNGGDVDGFMKARGGYLSETEARLILRQLVTGLLAIRDKQVMHRDLKLPNILMNFPSLTMTEYNKEGFSTKKYVSELNIVGGKLGQNSVPFEVKIADLGFARRLDHDSLAATRLGTPLVMAPEVLEGNKYDHSADVWSLGCIFYEMLTGFSPFTGNN